MPADWANDAAEPMPRDELLEHLNVLLAAERAGAATARHYAADATRAAGDALRDAAAEADRCIAELTAMIGGLGGTPTDAVGEFYEKAVAIDDPQRRMAFLNRGQAWVARAIEESLPEIGEPAMRDALAAMLDRRRAVIERCARAGA